MSAIGLTQTLLATQLIEAITKDIESGNHPINLASGRIENGATADWLRELAALLQPAEPAPVSPDILKAAQDVVKAWSIEGRAPAYHRAIQQRLRDDWVALAWAVEALVKAFSETSVLPKLSPLSYVFTDADGPDQPGGAADADTLREDVIRISVLPQGTVWAAKLGDRTALGTSALDAIQGVLDPSTKAFNGA